MNAATSLLDFILNLLKDPQAQAEFRTSPEHVLAVHGLSDVSAADIHETLPLVTDHRSVELTSSNHSAPPPVLAAPGQGGTHAAIEYLRYITNTYTYDVHIDEPAHVNIWAVGDVTQTLDEHHVVPGSSSPAAPDPDGREGTGHWTGDGHGNTLGQSNTFIYGDHTNGLIYGDHAQDGPVESSPSSAAASHPGDSQLYGFGSGAPATSPSGTASPAAYSGDGGSHGGSGSSIPADSGSAASTTSPDDSGHPDEGHSSLGDSYYGQDSDHGTYDSHEPHWYLDLH